MITPSDGDSGKFMWFSFAVCPRPSPFLPYNIVFSFLSLANLVGLIENPRYIYIQAHVFVDDEQATSSLQPSARPYRRT